MNIEIDFYQHEYNIKECILELETIKLNKSRFTSDELEMIKMEFCTLCFFFDGFSAYVLRESEEYAYIMDNLIDELIKLYNDTFDK